MCILLNLSNFYKAVFFTIVHIFNNQHIWVSLDALGVHSCYEEIMK